MCALIFLFAYTIYVASALVAGTSVFTTLFPDISPKIAMFAFLLIIVAYTFFGGFAAVLLDGFLPGPSDDGGADAGAYRRLFRPQRAA